MKDKKGQERTKKNKKGQFWHVGGNKVLITKSGWVYCLLWRTKKDSFVFEGGLKTATDSESPGRQWRTKRDKKGRTKKDSFDIVGGNKVLIAKSGRVDYEGQKRTKKDSFDFKGGVINIKILRKVVLIVKDKKVQKGTKKDKKGQMSQDPRR